MVIQRLKRHFDFLEMRDTPLKAFTRTFVLQMRKNNKNQTRFGFTISKKISKLAVERNRLRRQMREIVRLNADITKQYPSHDFVLIARKEALNHSYQELERDFQYLLTHLETEIKDEA